MPNYEIRFNVTADSPEQGIGLVLAGEVGMAHITEDGTETSTELSVLDKVSSRIGTATSGTNVCRFERPSLNIIVWPDRGQLEIWTRKGDSFSAVGDDAEAVALWLRDNLTIPFLQGKPNVRL